MSAPASTLGKFVWYELLTTDVAGARAFYGGVVGWHIKDSEMPDMEYLIAHSGETRVAGMMKRPPRADGVHPNWSGYIAVPDVDEYCKRVEAAGGKVFMPGQDIPTVGRFAVVADPGDAMFVLFTGIGDAPIVDASLPGTVGWHELHGGDPQVYFEFYSGLFGWTKTGEMSMGPMGTYLMFAIDGVESGGMMQKTPDTPAAIWLYYVNVASADAAAEAITNAGGKVLRGPHEVPGGQMIVQGLDPQGAMFAVVAPPAS